MTASAPLFALRVREILRTWRIWVLPAVLLFLAVTGPVITRFTMEILAGAFGDTDAAALPIPDPTAAEAAGRWVSDLSQLAVFVVVVMAAGAINSEVRSGVASLLLVKPVSRTAYVVSHATVLTLFVAVSALLGAVVSWVVTGVVFTGGAESVGHDLSAILGATAVWIVLAALLIAVSILGSASFDAMVAAAGLGIGTYFLLALAGTAPRLAEYTPAGLISLASSLATGVPVETSAVWWPVVTGLLVAVLLVWGAVVVFRRRELR